MKQSFKKRIVCAFWSKLLPAVCNVLSRSLEIIDLTSIPLSLHRDPWSHEYQSVQIFPIVSETRLSRISVCRFDTVLNTGSKITGLNYSSTYLKLLAKLNLWFMDLLYVNILQLKIIRIYVQGKSLKLFSDCCTDLTCPSTMKYINERKKEIRNYFYLVNSIMRPSCVFERKREIINIL